MSSRAGARGQKGQGSEEGKVTWCVKSRRYGAWNATLRDFGARITGDGRSWCLKSQGRGVAGLAGTQPARVEALGEANSIFLGCSSLRNGQRGTTLSLTAAL